MALALLLGSWLAFAPPQQRVAPLPLHARGGARAPPLRANAQQPYRSDAKFDYFRIPRSLTVTLTKPLGAVLEDAAPAGVKVEDLQEGGSAAETGLLKKGDMLRSVMGTDVSEASFDEVMALLIDAPAEVELGVRRVVISRKPREAPTPLTLTVDGTPVEVVKGVVMRSAIQEAGLTIHKGMKAKMSSCGGVGQCASCWVEVLDGEENLSAPTASELKRGQKKPAGYRMACQSTVNGPVSVDVKSLD